MGNPDRCPRRDSHGVRGLKECEICGWKAPPEKTLPPRKTFQDSSWRVLLHDGTVGETCDAPSVEERDRWATEDREIERQNNAKPFVPPKVFSEGNWRWTSPEGTPGEKCPPPTAAEKEEWRARAGAGAEGPRPFPRHTEAPPPGTRLYKVLTQRDEWFMGKFSPEKLETAVNHYALQGWRVVGVATADVGAWWGSFAGGMRQEIVVFMEKTIE